MHVGRGTESAAVAVAIVTYGDRAHLLSRVLDGLGAQTVAQRILAVCVCDNGAGPKTKELLSAVKRQQPALTVVEFGENRGSAGGYKRAIATAATTGADYIWCLDDDNVPAPDALEYLLHTAEMLEPDAALLAFREDRVMYQRLASGASLEDALGRRFNFLAFSIADVPKLVRRRLAGSGAQPLGARYRTAPIAIPYAPYGGFFFKRSQLSRVGLPREELFTGSDDNEFTHRFSASGYPIYLVPTSRVQDLESTWDHRTGVLRVLGHRILFDTERDKMARVYFPVRNGVWFRSYVLGWRHHPLYLLNGLAYLVCMFAQASVMRICGHRLAWWSFRMMLRGVRHGFQGRLENVETARHCSNPR